MSADFSKILAHLGANLEGHARRDGLSPVRAAVFLARGGHAPGEICPSEPTPTVPHHYECQWPNNECTCHLYGVRPTAPS